MRDSGTTPGELKEYPCQCGDDEGKLTAGAAIITSVLVPYS